MRPGDISEVDLAGHLSRVSFLGTVPRPVLEVLAGRSAHHRLVRGEFLFHQGDPGDRLHVIVTGRVAAVMTSARGQRLLLHVATDGETPGHIDVLGGLRRTASAEVLAPTDVITVPRTEVLRVLTDHPTALLAMADDLGAIVRALNGTVADLVFLDLPRRLARYLLLVSAGDDVVRLGMTQSDVAARLGATRQSLNQAMRRLAGPGWIRTEGRDTVHILDAGALAAFTKA